jgi:hypothetical protein
MQLDAEVPVARFGGQSEYSGKSVGDSNRTSILTDHQLILPLRP